MFHEMNAKRNKLTTKRRGILHRVIRTQLIQTGTETVKVAGFALIDTTNLGLCLTQRGASDLEDTD
jgi:hypothetical protein